MDNAVRRPAIPETIFVLADAVGSVGGAARATLLLCEALADAGSRVTVFATTQPDRSTRLALAARNIVLKTAPLQKGWRFGLPVRSLALRAWIAMRRSPDAVLHVVGLTAELHNFLVLPGRFSTFAWETTDALPNNKFVSRGAIAKLHKIHTLLVPSRTVEANARNTYKFNGRTAILPFWTEDKAKAAHHSVPVEKRFLFVGRMDPDKGFRFLVPAFVSLRKEFHDAALDICGSGNPLSIPELTSPADGVAVHGNVSDAELTSKLAACFAMVLPSLHEGYPLSLLDACAFSKPVIATSVGSIPEVFDGRECALLVPKGDARALERAMKTLLEEDTVKYAARCADARKLFDTVSSDAAVRASLEAAYAAA